GERRGGERGAGTRREEPPTGGPQRAVSGVRPGLRELPGKHEAPHDVLDVITRAGVHAGPGPATDSIEVAVEIAREKIDRVALAERPVELDAGDARRGGEIHDREPRSPRDALAAEVEDQPVQDCKAPTAGELPGAVRHPELLDDAVVGGLAPLRRLEELVEDQRAHMLAPPEQRGRPPEPARADDPQPQHTASFPGAVGLRAWKASFRRRAEPAIVKSAATRRRPASPLSRPRSASPSRLMRDRAAPATSS